MAEDEQHAVNDRKICSVGAIPKAKRRSHGNHCEASGYLRIRGDRSGVLPEIVNQAPCPSPSIFHRKTERMFEKIDAPPAVGRGVSLLLFWFFRPRTESRYGALNVTELK